MNVTFEAVNSGDVPELLSLAERAIESDVLPILSEQGRESMLRATRASVAQFSDHQRYKTLKAMSGSRIVGYIVWRDGRYVSQLYVDPQFHGQGIGSELMREMCSRVTDFPISVRASANAVRFYEKFGFRAVSGELSDAGIRYVSMEYEQNSSLSEA